MKKSKSIVSSGLKSKMLAKSKVVGKPLGVVKRSVTKIIPQLSNCQDLSHDMEKEERERL